MPALHLPNWIRYERGERAGDDGKFIRIDKVLVEFGGKWLRLNGCVVTMRDGTSGPTRKRTIHNCTITDGLKIWWLLERNGLSGLRELRKHDKKAAFKAAAK